MPSIVSVETALPERRYTLNEVGRAGAAWLRDDPSAAALFERFLRSSETGDRYFAAPLDEVLGLGGMARRAAMFEELGVPLGVRALSKALAHQNLSADRVDQVVFTSCTAPLIPSIDALVVEQSGLSRTVGRIPIYQHGCAGGVIGLEIGRDLAATKKLVAVTAVELCSLVFQPLNHRAAQLVGSAIFADGAACALIGPEERGLTFVDCRSFLLPATRHLMGYDILDDGMHLRLDRDLPHALAEAAPNLVGEFLARSGLAPRDIGYWLFHPGGVKILDFLERSFDLRPEQARWSREVLGSVGNLSSATILYVLKAFLDSRVIAAGEYAVMMGIGPGLTVELILFRWVGAR